MNPSSYKVFYSPKARDDLFDIVSYIVYDLSNPEAGRRIRSLLSKSIRQLDSMPFRHPSVDYEPWKSRGVRRMPVARFSVFYRIDENSRHVEIIRIIHGTMDAIRIVEEEGRL